MPPLADPRAARTNKNGTQPGDEIYVYDIRVMRFMFMT